VSACTATVSSCAAPNLLAVVRWPLFSRRSPASSSILDSSCTTRFDSSSNSRSDISRVSAPLTFVAVELASPFSAMSLEGRITKVIRTPSRSPVATHPMALDTASLLEIPIRERLTRVEGVNLPCRRSDANDRQVWRRTMPLKSGHVRAAGIASSRGV
jgi:hypothetical protein